MDDRLKSQLQFIIEIDKIKSIFRQTRLYDHSRHENDAEHTWHMCVMAVVFGEYANEKGIDLLKVIRMALIHDIVEIDAGDTFLYSEKPKEQKLKEEMQAAKRIFGLLPEGQSEEFLNLWIEFEKKETPEALFAGAMDRIGPVMQNYLDEGYAWKKHGVTAKRVRAANSQIEKGSDTLWNYAKGLIDDAVARGYIKEE